MLSEHERRELKEIERGLCADAPEVTRGFEDGFYRKRRLWPYTMAISFAVILLLGSLVLQLEFTMLFAIGLTVGATAARRHARTQHHGGGHGSEFG